MISRVNPEAFRDTLIHGIKAAVERVGKRAITIFHEPVAR